MKVLIIPSWFPIGEDKLMGIYHKEYANAICEEGIKTDILYVYRQGLKHPLKYLFMKKYNVEREKGYNVYTMAMLNLEPISLKLHMYFYTRKLQKLYKKYLLTNEKPDLLHAQVVLPSGYATCKLGKKYDIPVVVTEHSSNFMQYFKNKNYAYGKYVLENARFSTVSKMMKNQAMEYTKKCDVIPNVVDTSIFDKVTVKKKSNGVIDLLVVSAFRIGKGIETVLGAVRELKKKDIKVHLNVIGDGYLMDYYKGKAFEYGVDGEVSFLGRKDKSEIASIMECTDIFVVTSNYESFCIPGVEALAAGLPIVSTKCGGPEEYLDEKCGELCEVKDSSSMADKIEYVYSNIKKYDRRHMKDIAKVYSYHEVASSAKKIYLELIKK